MITRDAITEVGEIFKPHGIKGELSLQLDADLTPDALRCFILEADGIFVPFFVETARRRGENSWLVKFDGIDNEIQAADLSRHLIYAVSDELPQQFKDDSDETDGINLYDLSGYTLADTDGYVFGIIDDIDDSTANILLHVKNNEGHFTFVPFAIDLIHDLDIPGKRLTMNLPEGIKDL